MRSIVALLATSVLLACSIGHRARAHSERQSVPTSPSVEFLLASAAADFHAHRPPYPARFREVHGGYAMNADGTRQYRLCGEFLPVREGSTAEWTRFVTIRTSGYEQYLGAQASNVCGRAGIVWDKRDLSPALQSRLDALR
jgi:hypothetical protein